MTNKKWIKYHETKNALSVAIANHIKAIDLVIVYNPRSDFNDGSYECMMESMGKYLMNNLQKKLEN